MDGLYVILEIGYIMGSVSEGKVMNLLPYFLDYQKPGSRSVLKTPLSTIRQSKYVMPMAESIVYSRMTVGIS